MGRGAEQPKQLKTVREAQAEEATHEMAVEETPTENKAEKKARKRQQREAAAAAAAAEMITQAETPEGKKGKKRKQQEAVEVADETPITDENASPQKSKKKKQKQDTVTEDISMTDETALPQKTKKQKPDAETAGSGWWAEHNCVITGVTPPEPAKTFRDCGFPKRLAKACEGKFDAPTVIQAAAWPLLMEGKDIVAIAKTGSGKTLGFTLPFLARSELGSSEPRAQPCKRPRMVVLAPTRELVQQISTVVEEFAGLASKEGGKYPVRTIVGGLPKWEQKQAIQSQGADIVCGTTGRLLDLAENDGALDLSGVELLVLDEADRMLDMGFVDDVKKIAAMCPATRQTVFFSATWPRAVHKLATSITRDGSTATVTVGARKSAPPPSSGDAATAEGSDEGAEEDVHTEGPPTANEKIKQLVEIMQHGKMKLPRLFELLWEHKDKKILIFGLYKKETANLEWQIQQKGFPEAKALQGDMTQTARNSVLDNFRSGRSKIMIATDVASRGLDVKDIDLVINYTFPLTIEDFVHRIGRTARGGKTGTAITLFNVGPAEGVQDEKQHAGDLARVLRQANQVVPPAIEKLANSTIGNKATKKKAHALYGNHFKDEAQMAKLEAKKVHTTFGDSDDE